MSLAPSTSPTPLDRRRWFETWAPPEAPWSLWAKPVLFAQAPVDEAITSPISSPPSLPSIPWPASSENLAIVIDLPGVASARLAVPAAQHGFQPVPLFNTTHGQSAVISVLPIVRTLLDDTAELVAAALPPDAAPAFLLDADRLTRGNLRPGMFDNRWMVLPQDFPSATRLKAAGLTGVLLIRERDLTPQSDLRAVLKLWQRDGLAIHAITLASPELRRQPVISGLASLGWLTAFAALALGLRRNSAGGFGSIIPRPSQG
jgi:hypothetical protein